MNPPRSIDFHQQVKPKTKKATFRQPFLIFVGPTGFVPKLRDSDPLSHLLILDVLYNLWILHELFNEFPALLFFYKSFNFSCFNSVLQGICK